MKLNLERLPQTSDLEKAYHHFLSNQQGDQHAMDCQQFALYAQWSRFDSRLGEICIKYLVFQWEKINPLELRAAFLSQPWPAVIGVFLEFTGRIIQDKGALFKRWKALVTSGIPKAHWEQFFIGKRRLGGAAMLDDARFSIEEYKAWGYLSREVMVNKGGVHGLGTFPSYSSATRSQILSHLLESNSRITTEQYWEAVMRSISRRQAERDLLSCLRLRPLGKTKGRYFIIRGAR